MINTFGYQELYSTFLGWYYYNQIAVYLIVSGLVLIIPTGIIVSSYIQSKTSQQYKAGVESSVNNVQTKGILLILFLIIFFIPYTNLSVTQLEFRLQDGTVQDIQTNDSTLHQSFSYGDYGSQVQVPIGWYVMMQLTGGFNTVVLSFFPDVDDIRNELETLESTAISNRALAHEINRFHNECFQKTLKYYDKKSTTYGDIMGQTILLEDKKVWMGSEEMIKLYGKNFTSSGFGCTHSSNGSPYSCPPLFRSDKPVNGFARQYRDVDPEYEIGQEFVGRPLCSDWWEERLKNDIYNHVAEKGLSSDLLPTLWDSIYTFGGVFVTEEERKNLIVKKAITNKQALTLTNPNMQYADTNRFTGGNAQAVSARAGFAYKQTLESSKTYTMIRSLPIIQGLVLLLFYFSLPLLLYFAGFSWKTLAVLLIGFWAIRFTTVLWHLAYWLDAFYIRSTVISGIDIQNNNLYDVNGGILDNDIMEYILILGYILFPIVFYSFLGWVGFRHFSQTNSAENQESSKSGDAGNRGQGLATKVGKKIITK